MRLLSGLFASSGERPSPWTLPSALQDQSHEGLNPVFYIPTSLVLGAHPNLSLQSLSTHLYAAPYSISRFRFSWASPVTLNPAPTFASSGWSWRSVHWQGPAFQAAATLPSSAPGRFPSPLVWPLCHHSHIRTESNTMQQTRWLFHSMVSATSARHSRRTVYSAILLLILFCKRRNTPRLLLAFGVFFQDENFDVFQKKNTDPCCVL